MSVDLQGHVFTNAGVAVSGATIDIFTVATAADEGTSSASATASTTTDSSGLWTSSNVAEGIYDVRITNGTEFRWLRYEDKIQLTTLEVAELRVRNPADTFEYDIVPAAIAADRTLNLPLLTGTATLVVTPLVEDLVLPDDVDLALGTGSDGLFRLSSANTTGTAEDIVLALSDDTQALHITDKAAVATNWALANTTDPNLYIHSNTTPATDFLRLGGHTGTVADIDVVGGTTLQFKIVGNVEATITASGLNLPANSDLLFTGTTGTNDIVLTNALADALSITDGSADILVIDTNTVGNVWTLMAAVGITGAVTITGDLSVDGDLDFTGPQEITTTSGDLTLNPTASLNVTLTAADADALTLNDGTTDYYNISTLITTDDVTAHTFDATTTTVTSDATTSAHLMTLNARTYNWDGGANITTEIDGLGLQILAPVIASDTATLVITQVSTLYVAAPDVTDAEVTGTLVLAAEFDGNVRIVGDLSLQAAATISNTTGDMTLDPTASLNVTLTANDADAFTLSDGGTDYYNIDTRTATNFLVHHKLNAANITDLTSASNTANTLVQVAGRVLDLNGGVEVISANFMQLEVVPMTFTANQATTVNDAFTVRVIPPTESTNITLTDAVGIEIGNAGGTPTNLHGIRIETLSAGATANFGITIGSSNADQNLIHVGVTEDALLSWDESATMFDFDEGVSLVAAKQLRLGGAGPAASGASNEITVFNGAPETTRTAGTAGVFAKDVITVATMHSADEDETQVAF